MTTVQVGLFVTVINLVVVVIMCKEMRREK